MMVTFVSQCEKNALKKTRRVLDAFANRIGDNTWQTIITEDGLLTVKKMLRQTASKSTAVSCHWIRSRSRSQFLWVVGNRLKFNIEGVVPVNYTSVNAIKMDETKMMTEIVYANTQKQLLSEHLFGVGYVAALLVEHLFGSNQSGLKQAAFVSGCLHDLGKLDPEYRTWLDKAIHKNKKQVVEPQEDGLHIDAAKFSFEKHPRHNEISLWLSQFITLEAALPNKKLIEFIEHTVYWHHAKPIRKDEYVKINDVHRKLNAAYKEKGLQELVEHSKLMMNAVMGIQNNYSNLAVSADFARCSIKYDEDIISGFRKIDLPHYKQYELEESFKSYIDDINFNAKANILRACVISADHQISALSAQKLTSYIETGTLDLLVENILQKESDLIQHIQQCLVGFEEKYPNSGRNQEQTVIAKALLDVEDVAVLNGPAGCGKTKIALEWAKLSDAKKIIWICPRVQVCEGLYQDLINDDYLPHGKIEICTGEFKHINNQGEVEPTPMGQEFSGDIVLTTIDQVINSITTHTNVTAFVDFLNSHIVFDEFHEYIPMPAFNLLFAELVQAQKLMGQKANTLLVSATPNYSFVENVLSIDSQDIKSIKSFNSSKYCINFELFDEAEKTQEHPLFKAQLPNSIVISNTATTAQQAFIHNQENENAIVFHGKFKAKDKQAIFNKVYESFKENGSKEFDVLRSGPIVQAALNITCTQMTSEFTLAENFLQRLGRLDRFGKSKQVNQYTVAIPKVIPESNGKVKGNCARFLNSTYAYRSAYAWYEFLQNNLVQEPLTINEIYQFYQNFYTSSQGQDAVEQDLICALKESVKVIAAKVHDPLRYTKKVKASDKKKIKKSSLRGDSRFVQMVVMNIESMSNYLITDDYAIDWQESDIDFSNCYTESLNLLRETGVMDYVAKKHHQIDETSPSNGIPKTKVGLRKQVLEGAAVDPQHPIYLSYTPSDLLTKLGEDKVEESAVYYLKGIKQIIGAMPFNKITQ
ncbi:CRISPR-associated endonuclease Cas3'' [Aliivibrio fischeri]|uniref:CRISPR-associated endonuclease Cas3'' n=1 Tax=Aliivibrio fischeri TaxID=668 RepID=UPI00080ED801|nr:CRISPR-associated endonuclease Cas3'' [Aliivibrio fischeri]MUH95711.1 CRISPR-associated endonuclease Cas3'' [Aliivibrio fischeri]MUI63010.1 CRISPR-associated endonuclease Cas3'' [Aliivibrio fischeri]OCH41140.1 CRISPR-associated endonuclease Cas3'' [Aliivibrio fischeri]OED56066.1 CRISPR-associated endonuclease Cas3'' [Aliivibrio fischeri]